MARYCLDTSAYSFLRRADANALTLISKAKWIGMPTVVIGELEAGHASGNRRETNDQLLNRFLQEAIVETVPVDRKVATLYGEIHAELKRRGLMVPSNDIWIAATAINSNSTLLTYDRHFLRIGRMDALILTPA